MPVIILLIIILGIALGVVTFFVVKSFIAPKKVANLANMLKQGKTGAVTRTAKQILAKEPRNTEAHYLLGKAYLAEDKNELALMEFKTVNQIGNYGGMCPEKQFREDIGRLFIKFNQPEEALKEYLLLIKMEPENGDYYFIAGTLFEERDKSEKALNYYRKTIQLEPRHSDAHYRLGFLLFRAKKPVEAKRELETAINLMPDNHKAYFYLGRLMKENHDYVSALHAFERAQRDPDFKVKALVERGVCYMNMQSYDSAISELERAIKLTAEDSSSETLYAKYFLAACYEKIRKIDQAVHLWEEIYTKKSSFRDVAEKLSSYQDIRADDRVKDYLTATMDQFHEICRRLTGALGLSVRDLNNIPNGCQVIAVEAESKWRNVRKVPKLIRFLRVADLIPESSIRAMHEEMKTLSVGRGIIATSSQFSRKAVDFAETRPIDLIDKDKLQNLLKKIELP
ncbi:MAG: tetratricopeptide repeat protein [Spirochaetia bacterium]